MIFVLLALLVASTSAANLNLERDEGCSSLGSLLQGASFSASSGTPGIPSTSGNVPWIPSASDTKPSLVVDLGESDVGSACTTAWASCGQQARISRVLFAGDPTKSDTTNQIKFFYSNDGATWHCISNGPSSVCRPFYSNNMPPVKGSDINKNDLPEAVNARYFKFEPIEPRKEGASSLRVDLIGCRE